MPALSMYHDSNVLRFDVFQDNIGEKVQKVVLKFQMRTLVLCFLVVLVGLVVVLLLFKNEQTNKKTPKLQAC